MLPGAVDDRFGLGGGVVVPIPSAVATALAVTPAGNVIVGGNAETSGNGQRQIVLASLLSDGGLDHKYGNDGILVLPAHLGHTCSSLMVQDDGSLIVARRLTGDSSGSIVHVDALGRRVTVVQVGKAMLSTKDSQHTNLTLAKLATTVDGRMVAAGSASREDGSVADFALARFHPGGRPDAGFGMNGLVTTDFAGRLYVVSAVLPGTDGGIFTVGTVQGEQSAHTAILHYESDGRLDGDFGQSGISVGAYGGDFGTALAGALLSSGDILIAGGRDAGENEVPFYAVYQSSGALRANFAVSDSLPGLSCLAGNLTTMGIDACRRVLLAGRVVHSRGFGVGVVRLDENGALDKSFGLGGLMTTQLSGNGGSATALAIDTEDRILLAADVGQSEGLLVLRMLNPEEGSSSVPNPTYMTPEQVDMEKRMLLDRIQQDHDLAMGINRGIQY